MSDSNSSNESVDEDTKEIEHLYQEYIELKDGTLFDVEETILSSKTNLFKSYKNLYFKAAHIMDMRYFLEICKNKGTESLRFTEIEQDQKAKKFIGKLFQFRTLFLNLYKTPKKLVDIMERIIKKKSLSIVYLAYYGFPVIYNYFLDTDSCKLAEKFLSKLIKRFNFDMKVISPFLSAFFSGAYYFHDILWNSMLNIVLSDSQTDLLNMLCQAIHIAATNLNIKILSKIYKLNKIETAKFIINSVIIPSMQIYQEMFTGTDIVQNLLRFFNKINYDSEEGKEISARICNSFFENDFFIKKTIEITNISFKEGLIISVQTTFLGHILNEMTNEDNLVSCTLKKEVQNLISANTSIQIPIYFCTESTAETIPPSDNLKFNGIWKHMKENASSMSVDPFTLLPYFENSARKTEITNSKEFTLFALNREILILRHKKSQLNEIVKLSQIGHLINDFLVLLNIYLQNIAHCIIKTARIFRIEKNIQPSHIVDIFKKSFEILSNNNLPKDIFVVPILYSIIDNTIKLTTPIKKIINQYNKINWKFINNEENPIVKVIPNEIMRLRKLIKNLTNIKTGHKMIIFDTIINEISLADELLRNNGYKTSATELFTIIIKNGNSGLILSEIISLMQISNSLGQSNIPNEFFKNIQLSLTWFSSLLHEKDDFVKTIFHSVSKNFGQ